MSKIVKASQIKVGDVLIKKFPDTAWTVEGVKWVGEHTVRIIAGGGTRIVMDFQDIETLENE
jgi:hypothetical protein